MDLKIEKTKKSIVIGIIFLFLGLAIAPNINANVSNTSTDNDIVEITIQVCGIQEAKTQTLKMTKQQCNEIEYLFNTILKNRLDNATTRKEIIIIFKESIIELNKYGLLGGLSVEQAQRLVTGKHHNYRDKKLCEISWNRNPQIDYINRFCLTAGSTSNTGSHGLIWRIPLQILFSLAYFIYRIRGNCLLLEIISDIEYKFGMRAMISNFNPFPIGHTLGFGGWGYVDYGSGPDYFKAPASGWVWTLGTNGVLKQNGSFWGKLIGLPLLFFLPVPFPAYGGIAIFPGALGFTGLKITLGLDSIFLGYSIIVKLGSTAPDNPWLI